MSTDAPSRRSLLGLAGLASLCCVGPGTAAVAGGTTVGLLGGAVQGAVIFAVLGVLGLLFRLWAGCSCSTGEADRKRSASTEPTASTPPVPSTADRNRNSPAGD